jgi:hypothetical protein
MEISQLLINTLALIGILTISTLIQFSIKYIIHYIKHKTFPTSIEEEKMSLLKEEILSLRETISRLEDENTEMSKALLRRIQ